MPTTFLIIATAVHCGAALGSEPRASQRALDVGDRALQAQDPNLVDGDSLLLFTGDFERRPASLPPGVRSDSPIMLIDTADNLVLFPTALNGQNGGAQWSEPGLSLNRWRGTVSSGRVAYAFATDVGGNASKKVRLMATTAVAPDQFLFGMRYDLLRSTSPEVRLEIAPSPEQPAVLEHDLYVTSLATTWTSEAIHSTSTFVAARILWGGTCADDCEDIGLPFGALPGIYALSNSCQGPGAFCTLHWIDTAPAGQLPGKPAAMAIGQWARIRHEFTIGGDVRTLLDFGDGTGFHLLYEEQFITVTRFDGVGANGSFEAAQSALYIDNIGVSGSVHTPPSPPQPLACGPNDYSDDAQWLTLGPLRSQHPLWLDALTSNALVEEHAGADRRIRQDNWYSNDEHRTEFTRTLPEVTAAFGETWRLCEETQFTPAPGGQHSTVRAFAPFSGIADAPATRLAFGHFDPAQTPAYIGRVFIQHNPAYEPHDDEGIADPYSPGPSGNGGVARIGGVATIGDPDFDYFDTGVAFALDQPRRWCVEVAEDLSMTVSYGQVTLSGGATGIALDAFTMSISELRHESENQLAGAGDRLVIDDILLACGDIICNCPFPVRSLVYADNLEWAIVGATISTNDDDNNRSTPFFWSSAANMPVVLLNPPFKKSLKMENLLRDRVQAPGNFTLLQQASTAVPRVVPSPTRGYAVTADCLLSDLATTRAWLTAEATTIPGLNMATTTLCYSADTGTFWVRIGHPTIPNTTIWQDLNRTPASLGVMPGQWFTLGIHFNLDGFFTFRINGQWLANDQGQIVHAKPLHSSSSPEASALDRFFFMSGNDSSAPPGSILYADNMRAWSLPCADVTGDGRVSFEDLNVVVSSFNTAHPSDRLPNIAPDLDGDGVADDDFIGFADLNAVLGQFNQPCD